MKYVPKSVTRFASRSLLQLSAKSPTILVVTGVVGLGATAIMAARATRKIDPVLEDHAKSRMDVANLHLSKREEQKVLLDLYFSTGIKLGKIYGPAVFVGTTSAIGVLGGHRILVGRHVATMAAYSGLFQEFKAYRNRVVAALGVEHERALHEGASLDWEEDPNHKGEFKLKANYPELNPDSDIYLRPWFKKGNPNWTTSPETNAYFLQGVQAHLNRVYQTKGHVFLNDVCDDLRLPRTPEGAVTGWFRDDDIGDGYIDFGFMTNEAFYKNYETTDVQLNFNIDGLIWDKI